MSVSNRSRRRGAVAALVAALGIIAGVLASAGPAGAVDAPVDRFGVVQVYPAVVLDPANNQNRDDPCYARAQARASAEALVVTRGESYALELALLRRQAGSVTAVHEAHQALIEARIALIAARYAEARCHLRLTNGGQGDKCKELWLDFNQIADEVAQLKEIVTSLTAQLRATALEPRAQRLAIQAKLDAANLRLHNREGDLADQLRKIKTDPLCKNTNQIRPVPELLPMPREVRPTNRTDAPTDTPSTGTPTSSAPTTGAPSTGAPTVTDTPGQEPTGTDPGDADADFDPAADDNPYFDPADLADLDIDPAILIDLGIIPADPDGPAGTDPDTPATRTAAAPVG